MYLLYELRTGLRVTVAEMHTRTPILLFYILRDLLLITFYPVVIISVVCSLYSCSRLAAMAPTHKQQDQSDVPFTTDKIVTIVPQKNIPVPTTSSKPICSFVAAVSGPNFHHMRAGKMNITSDPQVEAFAKFPVLGNTAE